jgi:hypothetical protein
MILSSEGFYACCECCDRANAICWMPIMAVGLLCSMCTICVSKQNMLEMVPAVTC